MRTLLGSVALMVGGFLAIGTVFVALDYPGADRWVLVASGSLAVLLLGTSVFFVLAKRGESSRAWVIAVPAVAAGLAGLVLGISRYFKYCGIETRNQGYRLTVRVFDKVLHEEDGPALQTTDKGSTSFGPSQELAGKMACWEIGLDAAFTGGGALLGGLLGVVIRQVTRPRPVPGPRAMLNQ